MRSGKIAEAHMTPADEDKVREAFDSPDGWVNLAFPDDLRRDKFLAALLKAGLKKGSEVSVDSEALSVKSMPVKRLKLQGPIARGLQKLEAGLAIDPGRSAPSSPSFWRESIEEDFVPEQGKVVGYDDSCDSAVVDEAPVDWKKSFKSAQKGFAKGTPPTEVPKGPKKAPQAKPARAGGPADDPLKTTTASEMFETDAGSYFLSKRIGGGYHATFVSSDYSNAQDLGQFPSRKEGIDAVLGHHDRLAGGIGESMVHTVIEAGPGEDEFQDYEGPIHPHLEKRRQELQQTIDWIATTLDAEGTPEMKRISAQLKGISGRPSDQVLPSLAQAWDVLRKANRTLGTTKTDKDLASRQKRTQAIGDALKAFPSMMKAANDLTKSAHQTSKGGFAKGTDAGLWKTKPKGRWDDEVGFIPSGGTITYPTGQEPQSAMDKRAASAVAQKAATMAKVAPSVRKPGQASAVPPKGPVKPTTPASVLQRIKPTVRKKEESFSESAWYALSSMTESPDDPAGMQGKTIHVPQHSVADGFISPFKLHQAKQAGKKITWKDVPPEAKKSARVDDDPTLRWGEANYEVLPDGELVFKKEAWDTSD